MQQSFLKKCRVYFREYCTHTSVHGFQYFGEKSRHVLERLWWIGIFLVCLSLCTFSIYEVYQKWDSSPVIVNFANKGTPIYNIPFPALTICPESKSNQLEFNFTRILQMKEDALNLTAREETHFEYLSLICNHFPHLNYLNLEFFSDEFYTILNQVKPKFLLANCSMIGIDIPDCLKLFTPLLTDEGICYSFNILDRTQIYRDSVVLFDDFHRIDEEATNKTSWTLQDGYATSAGLEPYPLRAYLAGASNGLTINILTPKEDLDYSCRSSLQGYKIVLHTPLTIPRPSLRYFRLPLDQNVLAAVQPTMITTSKRIKAYDPTKRNCYFSGERRLQYFQNYTSSNCNLECLTNYTLLFCGCVNFYMPSRGRTEQKFVGLVQLNAFGMLYVSALKLMQLANLQIQLDERFEGKDLKGLTCNCLPICSDLTYEVETSQTDFQWMKMLEARRDLPRIDNNSHLTTLTIFFKSDNFITSERNELYGPLDFLANFGGILGLFTGFSILSLMEIFYFLTIRICCNLRLFGSWAGQDN